MQRRVLTFDIEGEIEKTVAHGHRFQLAHAVATFAQGVAHLDHIVALLANKDLLLRHGVALLDDDALLPRYQAMLFDLPGRWREEGSPGMVRAGRR